MPDELKVSTSKPRRRLSIDRVTGKTSPGGTRSMGLVVSAEPAPAPAPAEAKPAAARRRSPAKQPAKQLLATADVDDHEAWQRQQAEADEALFADARMAADQMGPDDILAKYGAVDPDAESSEEDEGDAEEPQPGPVQPQGAGAEFEGEFEWNGVSQLQQLQETNQQLLLELDEKSRDLDQMQVLLEAVQPVPGLRAEELLDVMEGTEVVDQDPKAAKIIHLAKKVRDLTVKLRAERARCKKAQQAAQQAQLEAEALGSAAARARARPTSPIAATAADGDDDLRDQLHAVRRAAADTRRKLEARTAEAQKLRRLLHREAGADVDVDELLKDDTAWRGRAQQIVMLRSKVRRLEAAREEAGLGPLSSMSTVAPASTRRAPRTIDDRAEGDLAEMSQAVEELTLAYDAKVAEADKLTRRVEAARARVRVLENEASKHKESLHTLLDKSDSDDQLIEALRGELQQLRRRARRQAGAAEAASSALTTESGRAESLERVQAHNEALTRQLAQQDAQMRQLRDEVRRLQLSSSSPASPSPGPPEPSRETRRKAQAAVDRASAKERQMSVENRRLGELVDVYKAQAEELEHRHAELVGRCGRLERRTADLELAAGDRAASRAGADVATLQAQIDSLQGENDALRRTFQASLAARQREIEGLERELSARDDF